MYQRTIPGMIRRLSDWAEFPESDDCQAYLEYKAWLAEGNTLAPADEPVEADPRIKRLEAIDQAAQLTPRAFRELVILMTEGFKVATAGALDLTAVPGVAQVYTLETEAQALRSELGLLTAPE